jgi:hypothetical protein
LSALFLAGCENEQHVGVLTGYDEVNAEDHIYWLEFEDGTHWKVQHDDHFFPLGQKIRVEVVSQGSCKPAKVICLEILRSGGPVEHTVAFEAKEKPN